jgi:hypothetical protein
VLPYASPLIFERFTVKSFIPFDLTDCLQGAAFVERGTLKESRPPLEVAGEVPEYGNSVAFLAREQASATYPWLHGPGGDR